MDRYLIAHGGRISVAGGAGAQRGPGQPAGQQLAALNPNAGRALVLKTAMVDLGDAAEAYHVLMRRERAAMSVMPRRMASARDRRSHRNV